MGKVTTVELLYDRQDRSRGIAFVTMPNPRDAADAVRDYDGANANGQPIRVSLMSSAPANRPRNPFDTAERPNRSLFDRVEKPSRSESPKPRARRDDRADRSENIDRYVPGQRSGSQRRSPLPGRRGGGNDGRRGSRRPGERQRRPQNDGEGHKIVQGRPRKTAEELDAEMADYFNAGGKKEGSASAQNPATTGAAAPVDGDVDMIE